MLPTQCKTKIFYYYYFFFDGGHIGRDFSVDSRI